MSTISIEDVRRDPMGFVDRMEKGESLLVVRGKQPLAEVKPIPQGEGEPRPYGLAAGEFTVPEDFDHPLPEDVLAEFERK